MKFLFKRNTALPQLAWCARLRSGKPLVEVEHGSSVETAGDFFYEGAWNGGFSAEEYLASPIVVGTGGALSGTQSHFVPGSDRVSPLFSIVNKSGTYVSNSPIFVMASADEHLDPVYPFYFDDFVRFWRMGLHCPAGKLRLVSGNRLNVHFFTKVIVGKEGEMVYRPHTPGPVFDSYQSYHSVLEEGVKKVFTHAADPMRKQILSPLAAISKGYDSTATACLAARAGCREAYTFLDSKKEKKDADSGKANAAILGMECREYDRWEYQQMPAVNEAEFAMVGIAVLTPLAALSEKLKGKLLITANYGDLIWGTVESGYCDDLTMPWARFLSGVGQWEFRLRTGYHVMDPTCIGARHNTEIHRIIHSSEMKPWWVKGSYNRPIPRRIAEEAGLSRDQFGMNKHAGGHATYKKGEGFKASSRQDYLDYIKSRDATCGALRKWYWEKRYWLIHALRQRFQRPHGSIKSTPGGVGTCRICSTPGPWKIPGPINLPFSGRSKNCVPVILVRQV